MVRQRGSIFVAGIRSHSHGPTKPGSEVAAKVGVDNFVPVYGSLSQLRISYLISYSLVSIFKCIKAATQLQ